jgi:hypothetical protein
MRASRFEIEGSSLVNMGLLTFVVEKKRQVSAADQAQSLAADPFNV